MVFDSDTANSKKDEFVEQLRGLQREQVIKDFEHHLRHQQKKLQVTLKFIDDLTSSLKNKSLENKKDFNQLMKHYQNKMKDFEKTIKRREKFFSKDLLQPAEKEFDKRLKSLISGLKTESRGWKVKEE